MRTETQSLDDDLCFLHSPTRQRKIVRVNFFQNTFYLPDSMITIVALCPGLEGRCFWRKILALSSFFMSKCATREDKNNCLIAFAMNEILGPEAKILPTEEQSPWGNILLITKSGVGVTFPKFLVRPCKSLLGGDCGFYRWLDAVDNELGRHVMNVTPRKMSRYCFDRAIYLLMAEVKVRKKITEVSHAG